MTCMIFLEKFGEAKQYSREPEYINAIGQLHPVTTETRGQVKDYSQQLDDITKNQCYQHWRKIGRFPRNRDFFADPISLQKIAPKIGPICSGFLPLFSREIGPINRESMEKIGQPWTGTEKVVFKLVFFIFFFSFWVQHSTRRWAKSLRGQVKRGVSRDQQQI